MQCHGQKKKDKRTNKGDMFEDTKRVIGIRKARNRHNNGQTKKDKGINNDLI